MNGVINALYFLSEVNYALALYTKPFIKFNNDYNPDFALFLSLVVSFFDYCCCFTNDSDSNNGATEFKIYLIEAHIGKH